jgi:hypothetical protein
MTHLQDIIMTLDIEHDREWWTTPRSLSGGRMVLPLDFVADDLYGYFFYDHQELERWIDGIVRVAIGELRFCLSVNCLKELSEFKKILSFIAEEKGKQFDSNLNGMSFSALQSRYSSRILQFSSRLRESISSLRLIPNPHYSIKKICNFYEIQSLGPYTSSSSPWCIAYSEKKFSAFSANGINSIYVLLHDDYKTIGELDIGHESDLYLKSIGRDSASPYDDYGLSMLLLVLDPYGTLIYCTSRWNHTFTHSSHDYLNERQISMLIGRNFYEIFC